MVILAQTTAPDLTAWLVGTPVTVLAFLVVAFMRGWIVPGPTYQRRLKEIDELTVELRRQQTVWADQVIPLMTRTLDLLRRATEREAA